MSWKPSKPSFGGSFTPMFTNPTTRFLPSAKNVVSGVLLPAFNWDLQPGSAEFMQSYIPYRSAEAADSSGHPEITLNCAWILQHTRVGSKEEDFVSAASRQNLWRRETDHGTLDDPIIDIYQVAKRDDSGFKHLTQDKSDKNGKFALLSYPSTKLVFNVLGVNAKDAGASPQQGVLIMPKASWPEFVRLMNISRMAGQVPTPRDPDWPDYLYGDVTNPNRPLEFKTIQRENASNASQKYSGWMFSNNEVSLMGALNAPVITQDVMAKRVNVWDPEVYNIVGYQDLLDRIMGEAWYPAELVKRACGERANIGGVQHTGQPQPAYTPAPAQQPAYTPPPAQAYTPAPAQQQAPTESIPMEHKYWLNSPAGVVLTERGVIQVNMGVQPGNDPMVMSEDQTSGWVPASSLGFTVTPVAPAPPAAPAPPPAAPAPPAPPAPPVPPAAFQAYTPPAAPLAQPELLQAPAPQAPAPAGPYASEYAGKSKQELSSIMEQLTAQLATGQMVPEDLKKLQAVGDALNAAV